MVELRNEQLSVVVSEKGAELQSIKDASGKEYLWQADPNFWPRHSPILFPIVCSVNNDTYSVDGKEYHLPRHGFARDTEFKLIAQNDRKVTFALESSEETKKQKQVCRRCLHLSRLNRNRRSFWSTGTSMKRSC